MNISGYEFQVIFCVLILLGLASVALVVDYLKGMNEKLRERHVDLMARHEVVVQRVEEDNTRLLRALAEQSKSFREMTKNSIQVTTKPAETAMPEITLTPIAEAPAEPVLKTGGPVAVAEPNPEPPAKVNPPVAPEESLPSNVIRIRLKPNNPEPVAKAEVSEPNFDRFLEELVSEFEAAPENAEPAPGLETLAQKLEEFENVLEVPAGAHPPSVLNQLLEREEPLTGLVISVGINEYLKFDEIHGRSAAEQLLNTVDALIQEVAGEQGFCTRRSDDEFVLIYPRLTGAAAQQRLSETAERLWDYQLQTLGTFTVVFSWGATEAQRQMLAEALTTASENMVETRGTRKNVSSEPGQKQRATA